MVPVCSSQVNCPNKVKIVSRMNNTILLTSCPDTLVPHCVKNHFFLSNSFLPVSVYMNAWPGTTPVLKPLFFSQLFSSLFRCTMTPVLKTLFLKKIPPYFCVNETLTKVHPFFSTPLFQLAFRQWLHWTDLQQGKVRQSLKGLLIHTHTIPTKANSH